MAGCGGGGGTVGPEPVDISGAWPSYTYVVKYWDGETLTGYGSGEVFQDGGGFTMFLTGSFSRNGGRAGSEAANWYGGALDGASVTIDTRHTFMYRARPLSGRLAGSGTASANRIDLSFTFASGLGSADGVLTMMR